MIQQEPTTFYITGGTVPRDAISYVARNADETLFTAISRGQFCYVLTPRQMGKSSLMVRAADRLTRNGAHVVVLDLSALGQNLSVAQWYKGMLSRIGRQLGLEDEIDAFCTVHADLSPLDCWMRAIQEVALAQIDGQIVIFIDEIDMVRSLPFETDELFAGIRACYNHRDQEPEFQRLTFCLLGVASPSDLIRNVLITPFNIGKRIELDDFTAQEAAALSAGISVTGRNGEALLARILYWTGGHPYLTQRLCAAVAADTTATRDQDVDRVCAELFLSRKARESDDNLAIVRNRLLKTETDLASLLGLYRQVRAGKSISDDDANPLCSILKLSGVVKAANGCLKVRNRIYAHVFDLAWVVRHMPDAELRRQRAAYRAGLFRAACIALVVILIMVFITGYALNQRNEAIVNAGRASRNAIAADKSKAEALHSAHIADLARADTLKKAAQLREALTAKSSALASEIRAAQFARTAAKTAKMAAQAAKSSERLAIRATAREHKALSEQRRQLSQSQSERGLSLLEKGEAHGLFDLADACASAKDFPALRRGQERVWQGWYAAYARDRARIIGFQQTITAFASSPDGRLLAIGTFDHYLHIYDVAAGKNVGNPLLHESEILHVEFNADATRLVCSTLENKLWLWNVPGGKAILLTHFEPDGYYYASENGPRSLSASIKPDLSWHIVHAAFTPDGKRLLVFLSSKTQGGYTVIYDPQTGIRRKYVLDYVLTPIRSAAISPDSKRCVKIYGDGHHLSVTDIDAMDTAARTGILERPPASADCNYEEEGIKLTAAMFSPDSRKLIVWDERDHLRLIDTQARLKTIQLKPLEHEVKYAVWAPNSKSLLIVHRDGFWRLLNAATLEDVGIGPQAPETFASPVFSPDGKWFAMASGHTLLYWDAHTVQPMEVSQWYPYPISNIRYLPASGLLAVVSGNAVCLSRIPSPPNHLVLLALRGTTNAMYNLAGTRVVAASSNFHARVWDTRTGRQVFADLDHESVVQEAFFTPDGKTIITRSDKRALAWDAATGKRLWIAPPEQDDIIAMTLSPNGKRLVVVAGVRDAHRCQIRQWDVATGKPVGAILRQPEMAFDLAYSPDGRLLAVEAGSIVHLLRADTMQDTGVMLRHNALVHSIEFFSDGKRILTASEDGTARVWDSRTGRASLLTLTHRDRVSIAIFSPDGSKIATGSSSGTIHLWDARTGMPAGALMQQNSPVNILAFSADGATLASNNDKSVQLWDLATRQRIGPGFPQIDAVKYFAFRPDGRQLMVVHNKGTVLIPLPSEPLPEPGSISLASQCAIWLRRDSQGQETVMLASDWLRLHNTLQTRTPPPRHH